MNTAHVKKAKERKLERARLAISRWETLRKAHLNNRLIELFGFNLEYVEKSLEKRDGRLLPPNYFEVEESIIRDWSESNPPPTSAYNIVCKHDFLILASRGLS